MAAAAAAVGVRALAVSTAPAPRARKKANWWETPRSRGLGSTGMVLR